MNKFFLIGMPGSGKSTMAKYISSISDLNYKDLDDEIEKKEGRTINEIFQIENENYFRNKESQILNDIILKENKFILATGGGTPCFNNNIRLINKSGISIFLNTSIDKIIERVKRKDKRPLFYKKNIEELVKNMLNNRIKFYSMSTYSVENNNREEVLSIINSNS
tara:strand:- start:112 stop:606 length:495 start_codon:yes stop_codon:yes gene_type:complete